MQLIVVKSQKQNLMKGEKRNGTRKSLYKSE